MSVTLDSVDVALIVFVQPIGGGDASEVDVRAFSDVLDDAHFSPEGERFVSARNQMSIVFDPPSFEVIDHSGVVTASVPMVAAGNRVLDIFRRIGYEMHGHGWRIEGKIPDLGTEHIATTLLDANRLSLLGPSDEASTRKVTLFGLEVPSQVTGDLMFTIRAEEDVLHVLAIGLVNEPLTFSEARGHSEKFAAEVLQLVDQVLS